MRESSIMDLIDDENLENALSLREKYIENATLSKKVIVLRTVKRISAACLAILFLMIPASVFLIHEDQILPPHAYTPILTEEKASFKELNDILGAEHLYNNLSEENSTSLRIHYGFKENQTYNNLIDLEMMLNYNPLPNVSTNALSDQISVSTPVSAEIHQRYQNGTYTDHLILNIFFNQKSNTAIYPTDVTTLIHDIPVCLSFPENTVAQASFVYQENLYILNLVSTGGIPDIDHYLEILLEGENP